MLEICVQKSLVDFWNLLKTPSVKLNWLKSLKVAWTFIKLPWKLIKRSSSKCIQVFE